MIPASVVVLMIALGVVLALFFMLAWMMDRLDHLRDENASLREQLDAHRDAALNRNLKPPLQREWIA